MVGLSKRFYVVFLLMAFCVTSTVLSQQKGIIKEVLFSELPGDRIQVYINTEGYVDYPEAFYMPNPANIVLDFNGVGKSFDNNRFTINKGRLHKVEAIMVANKTRIVLRLNGPTEYDIKQVSDGFIVTIENTNAVASSVSKPKPFVNTENNNSVKKVNNVDFRRSTEGGGQLIINVSDKSVINTQEVDGEIVVDVLNTQLPADLQRRLDVVDFATPVQYVDVFQNAENVRITLIPKGDFQYNALQNNDSFIIIVNKVIETAEEKAKKADELKGFKGERLSLNFQKIDVRSALAVIADFTGINFVTSDSVEGEVTLNLKDVPWDQALDVILRSKGLSKRQTDNIIWIAPAKEIAEIEENELKATRTANAFAPLVSELIQINYAKAEEIAKVIKSVRVVKQGSISSDSGIESDLRSSSNVTETDKNSLLTGRGSVTVDARTNSLLVQDVAGKIKELRKLIAKLDKPVRQVMIETRIVEANDSFSRELGVRFGFQRQVTDAQLLGSGNLGNFIGSGTTEGATTITDSLLDDDPGIIFDTSRNAPGGLAVDLGANGIDGNLPASYAFNIFRAGTGFADLITLELSALEADGRGKIIASPRLVTANQKRAVIKQGEERVFTVFGNDSVDVETKEAVLSLTVTPQITPDDRIILDVNITQDSFIANADTNVAAALRKKEIITQVLTENGETIVIGGIYQEEKSLGEVKVPFLGDIPLIGHLFKSQSRRNNRVELLVFMTPKIISPDLSLD